MLELQENLVSQAYIEQQGNPMWTTRAYTVTNGNMDAILDDCARDNALVLAHARRVQISDDEPVSHLPLFTSLGAQSTH